MPLVCMAQHREPKLQMNAAGFPPLISAGNPRPPPPSWVKLPPLTQAEQGENGGGSTMTPLCRKIVAMPLITFEGSEDCGKSTQMNGSPPVWKNGGSGRQFFGSPAAPRLAKPF